MPKSNNKKKNLSAAIKGQSNNKSKKNRKSNSSLHAKSQGLVLSPCAWKYARAVLDPFGAPGGACIPSIPTSMSRKFTTSIRGVMAVGTLGVGFVACNPFNGCSSTPSTCTTSTIAYASNVVATSTGVGVTADQTNSPYSSTTFSNSLATIKLVAAGLRVRYVGGLMYRAGQLTGLMNPNHGTLSGSTFNDLNKDRRALYGTVDGQWATVTYNAVSNNDYEEYYPGTNASNLDALTTSGQGLLAIMVAGGDPANGKFEYEFVGHYEIMSRMFSDQTPNECDPIGLAAAINVVAAKTKSGFFGQIDTGKIWNSIIDVGAAGLSSFGYGLAGGAVKALGGMVNHGVTSKSTPMIEEL